MDVRGALDELEERDWETDPDAGSVRMAVVGLGGFARDFAIPGILAGDHAELAVTVSGSAEKAEAWAEDYGATRGITYDEYHDGVAAEDYDAVYIVTPNALHLDFAETAAGLGKHVICEKPLEATADRAARLVDACEDAGVRLMTAYRLQTEPVLRRLRDLIADGLVGDPVWVTGAFAVRSFRGERTMEHWRYDAGLAGGGAMLDIGVYPLNTGRFLLGDDPVAVSGTTATRDPVFADVDEHVSFHLRYPDGVAGPCVASFNGQPSSILEVVGVDGRVHIDGAFEPRGTREVRIERGDAALSITAPPVDELREQFDYFAHAIRTGAEIEPDGTDGLVDMRVADAVYESADSGRRITL